jgi:hypothetical protein
MLDTPLRVRIILHTTAFYIFLFVVDWELIKHCVYLGKNF